MLILVITCITFVTQTYSLRTELCYNRTVRRKTEYRVNIWLPGNDIEMADFDKLIRFSNREHSNIGIKCKTHEQKSHKTPQNRRLIGKYKNTYITYPKITKSVQNLSRRLSLSRVRGGLISSKNSSNNSLTNGSYEDAKTNEKSDETYHTIEIDTGKSDLQKQVNPPRIARETSAGRIWNIVQIWLIVYFILAIPLWCTIGRCCCCLVCKCFKAHETIREAKQYAMWNPPGVLRKKTGDVVYTPSEKEKEAYEELEHLIRTL